MVTLALFVLIAFVLVALPPLIASLVFDFVRKDSESDELFNDSVASYARFELQTRFTSQDAKSIHWRSRFGKI